MITVRRIHTERGSHIEPEFDQTWPELVRLEWLAAVVECDTGLPVKVRPGGSQTSSGEPIPGTYSVSVGTASSSSFAYHELWIFLNGVNAGARAQREMEHYPQRWVTGLAPDQHDGSAT